jgi:hypothetical protein
MDIKFEYSTENGCIDELIKSSAAKEWPILMNNNKPACIPVYFR